MKKRIIACFLCIALSVTPAMTAFATEAGADQNTTQTAKEEAKPSEEGEETSEAESKKETTPVTENKTETPATDPAKDQKTPAAELTTVATSPTTTQTPPVTPEATETPVITPTVTPIPTETPSPTPTADPTETPSPTPVAEPTETPTPTPTPTETPTPTPGPEEKPEEVPYSHTETIEGYTISLKAAEGVFPEGTTVKIVKVSEARADQIEDIVSEEIKDRSVTKVIAFDITFYDKDGKVIEPEEGKVEVSITLAKEVKEAVKEAETPVVEVFHIDDKNNAEKVESDVTTEKVEFDAEEFTEYAIIITDGVLHGQCGPTLNWKLEPNGTLTISGTGEMTDIPWKEYKRNIKKLVLNNGITSIKDSAFSSTKISGSLTIPSTVKKIGSSAFSDCKNLTGNLALPDTLEELGGNAFGGCSGFTGSLHIPTGLTKIEYSVFDGCSGLTGTLTIPSNITLIENGAFGDCSFTGDLIVPGTVKTVHGKAFDGCKFTGNLTFEEGVEQICANGYDMSGFGGCTEATGVATFPSTLTKLEGYPLFLCHKLKKVINNSNHTVMLPSSLNRTDDIWVDDNNHAFEVLKIGQGVAIKNPSDRNGVAISGQCGPTLNWKLEPNGTLTISGTGEMTDIPWKEYKRNIKKLVLNNGITSIKDSAFSSTKISGSLTIPSTVKKIGSSAFSDCKNLTGNLALPDTLEELGGNAFGGCSGFTGSLHIPTGLTKIEYSVFDGCSGLTGTLTIPSNITLIENGAFGDCSFTGDLIVPGTVKTVHGKAFDGCKFTGNLTFEEGVEQICANGYDMSGFSGCTEATGVATFPSTLTKLEGHSLFMCHKLKKVINNSDHTVMLPSSLNRTNDIWVDNANPQFEVLSIKKGMALRKVNVCFEVNGNEYSKQVVISGERIVVPQDPSIVGKDFEGWYLGDTKWDFNNIVTSGMTLIAKWKEESNENDDSSHDGGSNIDENPVEFNRPPVSGNGVPVFNYLNNTGAVTLNTGIINTANTGKSAKPIDVKIDVKTVSTVDIVLQIKDAPEKSTITIEMNGNTEIDKKILESARGKDINVVLNMGAYKWTINGRNVTADDLQSINMEVKFGSDAIPADKLDRFGGDARKTISLSHEGDFGFAATLTLNVGEENFGKYANLYYYNKDDEDLEFLCYDTVKKNGEIDLIFTHASEYVAIMSDEMHEPISTADFQEKVIDGEVLGARADGGSSEQKIKQGVIDQGSMVILIVFVVIVAVGTGIFIYRKKRELF